MLVRGLLNSCATPVTFQTATLAPGSHSVYAAYSGDSLHSAGNSNTVTHAVTADTTAVTLATSATSMLLTRTPGAATSVGVISSGCAPPTR